MRRAPALSRVPGLAALSLIPGRADAHAFTAGADSYAQVIEGIGVVLFYPATLLPIIALGLLTSLWWRDGLPQVWAVYLAGLAGGIFLAAAVGPAITAVLMAAGIALSVLAALLPRHVWAEVAGLAGVTGVLVSAASFEGHGLFELSLFIHLGILIGANIALAAAAALAAIALEKVTAFWMQVAVRVAASWVAAILLLMLAFTLSAPAA